MLTTNGNGSEVTLCSVYVQHFQQVCKGIGISRSNLPWTATSVKRTIGNKESQCRK